MKLSDDLPADDVRWDRGVKARVRSALDSFIKEAQEQQEARISAWRRADDMTKLQQQAVRERDGANDKLAAAEEQIRLLRAALREHVIGSSYENDIAFENNVPAKTHCLQCSKTWSGPEGEHKSDCLAAPIGG